MEKRIRYIKQADGSFTSMRVLKNSTGADLRPVISPDGKTGAVTSAVSGEILITVRGTSAHKTKIALKEALETLGVVFIPETRRKRETV